jgi:hypothetical protein
VLRFGGQTEALTDPLQYGVVHGRRHFPCAPLGVEDERKHLLAAFGIAHGLEGGTAVECRNALRYPVLEMLGHEVLHSGLDLGLLCPPFSPVKAVAERKADELGDRPDVFQAPG